MKTQFKIKQVLPRIFLFEFKNNYDMCMHFMRYQEFYESPSSKFRGKEFTIFDFMRWYSLRHDEVFTYTDDWDGFNLPSNIIWDVWNKHLIPDKNIYDYEMHQAWLECNATINKDVVCTTKPINKFYIIGAVRGNGAVGHELCHGLFNLYPEYKKEMTKLVMALPSEVQKDIRAILKKGGYTPKVYVDEIQAYFATGLSDSFPDQDKWPEERKPFVKFYKKFLKGLKNEQR